MISAVIFDFDGIIVDSERLHWAAFNKVMEPLGKTISWPDYVQTYIGFDDRDTFRTAFPNIGNGELSGMIEKKAAAFQGLLESDGAAALPGSVYCNDLIFCYWAGRDSIIDRSNTAQKLLAGPAGIAAFEASFAANPPAVIQLDADEDGIVARSVHKFTGDYHTVLEAPLRILVRNEPGLTPPR